MEREREGSREGLYGRGHPQRDTYKLQETAAGRGEKPQI